MTKKIKTIVYGLGGFDEAKPDNNVVEIVYYTKTELDQLDAEEAAQATAQAEAEAKATAKADLLAKLGITAEEARLLLS